jgi:hypothetical protein
MTALVAHLISHFANLVALGAFRSRPRSRLADREGEDEGRERFDEPADQASDLQPEKRRDL